MRKLWAPALAVLLAAPSVDGQEFFDAVRDRLTLNAFDDNVRARLSGTIDLEYYRFQEPAPALIDAQGNDLFNPRLTLFLDAQLGPKVYFFSQLRFDRAFDPTDIPHAEIRLDEYALRFTPWEDGRLSIQIGKFATVIGNWMERHLSWDNPFINAPLPYENATAFEDHLAPFFYYGFDGLLHGPKSEYIPVIWGPSYASGVSVAGRLGKVEYAAEIKNASLSSRPESWDATRIGFEHPTVSGRLGFRPSPTWNFGLSGSHGAYFRPDAEHTLPSGTDIGDFPQTFLGQDISFAWRHLQIWAEVQETRFAVPRLGNADTLAYYIEAKYKFTPQLFGAARWGQQFFSKLPNPHGGEIRWSQNISRIETAVGYRFTPNMQLKLQYYLEDVKRADRDRSHTFAAQWTLRF
jgi:hypothetical protein